MSVRYMEEHDICFWKKEVDGSGYSSISHPSFAWHDWGLIPTSRPYVSTPKANYTLTQIPNSSNRLDITNYMPGGMTYESREGEWQFAIDHTHKIWKNWYEGYYKIEDFFHGARMLVSLNDDPEKVYDGRIRVSTYEPGDYHSAVTLSYNFDAMPIDENEMKKLIYRVRTIGYTGVITKEQYQSYGTTIVDGKNYDRPYLLPPGAVFSKWDPATPFSVKHNTDIYAKYYFKRTRNHTLQYIIETPMESVEESYEIPDTVKFLFNNTNHSIDFLGSQGETIKRNWYTPGNMDIETTE